MSHWLSGKLQLKCPIGLLRKAMINIMPEWEKNIKLDETGNLSMEKDKEYSGTYRSSQGGYSMVVNLVDTDVGFKKQADGNWTVDYGSMNSKSFPRKLQGQKALENAVLQEVASIRLIVNAKAKGMQVERDTTMGDDRVIRLIVPSNGAPIDLPGLKS